jgi:hypothetical protein
MTYYIWKTEAIYTAFTDALVDVFHYHRTAHAAAALSDTLFILNLKDLRPPLSRRPRTVWSTDRVDFCDPTKVTSQVGEHGETGERSFGDSFTCLRFQLDPCSERLYRDPGPFEFCNKTVSGG